MPETSLSPEIRRSIEQFFRAHALKRIDLSPSTDINGRNTVTDVAASCRSQQGGDYSINFKLQADAADISEFLVRMAVTPEVAVVFTEAGLALAAAGRAALLQRFLHSVDRRIREAKKEQEIQSIQYLGNTFELNKQTVFTVISDDGEGHLGIEILGKPPSQPLKLSAHGLLDGLYMGIIRQLEKPATERG